MAKPTSDGRVTWDALFDELLSDRAQITRDIRTRMQAQLPTFQGLRPETLDRDVERSFECTIRSARAGRDAVSAGELAELTEVGRSQALEGVPIEELLRAWRIGIEVSVSAARRLGTGLGSTDAEMLEFVTSVLAWSDVAMVETARGHRLAGELKASLREYFACGMNVERAAERLFVHQNTLRYRIGRFEDLTGASLRDPAAAFEVWWALEREAIRRPGGDQAL